MTTPDGNTPPLLPPDAETAQPRQWTDIGGVSTNHGEILLIANHAVSVPPGTAPWDRWIAYSILNPCRSPDGRVETFVVDQYAPAYESIRPGHAREDAMIVHTREGSAHTVEARTCTDAGSPGWCELRIKLHDHVPEDLGELLDDEADLPGYAATMSPEDSERWASARTLADLGELTAQWLEGGITSIPGYSGGPDEETEPLTPVLAACNRAGFVTIVSQPGEEPELGYDGQIWTQRAALEGFASTDTLEALRRHTAGTRLILTAVPTGRPEPTWETQIPVTLDGDQENTWFGSLLAHGDIENAETGYSICHPDAVAVLLSSWQVTVIDPEWGRNDILWPALEAFAASRT
jgi:hypothetical protein